MEFDKMAPFEGCAHLTKELELCPHSRPGRWSVGAISSPCAVSCWGQAEKSAARFWGPTAPRWLSEDCDASDSFRHSGPAHEPAPREDEAKRTREALGSSASSEMGSVT